MKENNVTSTSILVQWDEVPADNQNGIVVNYTVTYAELPAGDSGKEIVFASTAKEGGGVEERVSLLLSVSTDEDRKNSQFWYYPVGCYVLIWNL